VLVAYNVWLATTDLALARALARDVRGPDLRALGLAVGARTQVSMNLIAPARLGPADAFDLVAAAAAARGAHVDGAELVGLLPASVLRAIPRARWSELDVAEDRTIDARVAGAA
jgi:glutamate formiminotransferase